MAPHLTHVGVHDHGFNNVSTYGNLWRLMNEGRIAEDAWERQFYELALKVSGAVQAARWSQDARRHRLHLFLQRPAVAVRRYDPLLPVARAGAPARPRADGRARRANQPAAAAGRARHQHGPLQHLVRRRPRRVRRRRPHGARKRVQHEQRRLSLPVDAARLFAVQHVDPRPGLGDARLCRAARMARDAQRRRTRTRSAAAMRSKPRS